MKKMIIILCIVLFVTLLSFSFKQQQGYENLQVLPKSTNKHQMDSIMKHYSWSLGVNCDYCHVKSKNDMHDWDFASDSNYNKKTARDMTRMTMALNQQYFQASADSALQPGQAITCYSCHHGKEHPDAFPPRPVKPGTGR